MEKTLKINWNDADNQRLYPGLYKHIDSGEVIELNIAAAGFRLAYGDHGQNGNIFDLSKGTKYRRMTDNQITTEAENSEEQRAKWLKSGLVRGREHK